MTSGVRVSATATVKNSFGLLLHRSNSPIKAVAEAALAANSTYEIAFVLDNTGSMNDFNKIGTLKAAMNKFLGKLKVASTANDVKVSIVPFGTHVRMDASWARGKPFMKQTSAQLAGWQGCVTDRLAPYDVDATLPIPATPTTLFEGSDGSNNIFPLPPANPLFPFIPNSGHELRPRDHAAADEQLHVALRESGRDGRNRGDQPSHRP